ncbi:isocitrate lyase/phosphoenolpyruvate mutase family protein [Alphaproteobacteria bacterium KMM 3653]|uniref:Isocitrate lyase/phosphoenolpyruvate mutase family protein n=1 Tax=Harenicola maris TaxID=2841044 RepID=A0AAP2CPS1_9RHOB|nr:isocitrate lyase/phosphoenolpyruvate mutase family protein [Harenicola maris]
MSSFRALHRPGAPFVLANVWDIGSARVMAALGAQALATSSAGFGFTRGLADGGKLGRDASLAHAQEIVAATPLPVQGDFEDGFGEAPDVVAETVRLSGEIGLAGICVEDTALPGQGFYEFDLAVERIRAGAAAARALPRDFMFCARADGLLTGGYDLPEALRRIKAFAEAGADVLYAPMPTSMADLAAICAATDKPVNALAAGPFTQVPLADYAAAGAARISLGSSLARATQRVLIDAGSAVLQGDFSGLTPSAPAAEVDPLLQKGARNAG